MSRGLPTTRGHRFRGNAKKPTRDRVRTTTARHREERRWLEVDSRDKEITHHSHCTHVRLLYTRSCLLHRSTPCIVLSALHMHIQIVYWPPEGSQQWVRWQIYAELMGHRTPSTVGGSSRAVVALARRNHQPFVQSVAPNWSCRTILKVEPILNIDLVS